MAFTAAPPPDGTITDVRTQTWRLGATLLVAGVVAGLVAAGLTELLHAVQHLAFGYETGTFAVGVANAPAWRRVAALAVCGVVAGVGWYLLRRFQPAPVRVRVAVRAGDQQVD